MSDGPERSEGAPEATAGESPAPPDPLAKGEADCDGVGEIRSRVVRRSVAGRGGRIARGQPL